MPYGLYSSREIAERGQRMYEERIRSRVEQGNVGKFLVLNIETGHYEIDDDHLAASDRAATKYPGAPLYTVRIGQPTAGRIGARARLTE